MKVPQVRTQLTTRFNDVHQLNRMVVTVPQPRASWRGDQRTVVAQQQRQSIPLRPDCATQQQQIGPHWYLGTADAVYQNIDIIEDIAPEYMVILAGDHIYKMDYEIMLRQHVDSGADVTVACMEVPRMEAVAFGVMHVDANDRIVDFVEKPVSLSKLLRTVEKALALRQKFPELDREEMLH